MTARTAADKANRRRLRPLAFQVFLNAKHIASFSGYTEAMSYARDVSARIDALADVTNATGIIAQYQHAVLTAEFVHSTRDPGDRDRTEGLRAEVSGEPAQ